MDKIFLILTVLTFIFPGIVYGADGGSAQLFINNDWTTISYQLSENVPSEFTLESYVNDASGMGFTLGAGNAPGMIVGYDNVTGNSCFYNGDWHCTGNDPAKAGKLSRGINHFAVTNSGSISLYINGERIVDPGTYSVYLPNTAYLRLDNGYAQPIIDELRLSNIVRYTGSSFTPTYAPFVGDPNTIFLAHFDGSLNPTIGAYPVTRPSGLYGDPLLITGLVAPGVRTITPNTAVMESVGSLGTSLVSGYMGIIPVGIGITGGLMATLFGVGKLIAWVRGGIHG